MKILCVCTGNINRSIACKIILKTEFNISEVDSCGVSLNSSKRKKITSRMKKELLSEKTSEDIENHRSKLISQELIDSHDFYLVMQPSHYKYIINNFSVDKEKIIKLYELIGNKRINDPQFNNLFKLTLEELRKSIKIFLDGR